MAFDLEIANVAVYVNNVRKISCSVRIEHVHYLAQYKRSCRGVAHIAISLNH